mmetsp:Transcript_6953/g.8010  ORF Transcript_6953/g.8010 Transcript_6953/m.8010 type:complete len:168 (-) Transcript_6953:1077-1580(-)
MESRTNVVNLSLIVIMGLSYMFGLLMNDLVFNLTTEEVSRLFYCTLLDSFFKFPQVLRLAIPLVSVGLVLAIKVLLTLLGKMHAKSTENRNLEFYTFIILSFLGTLAFIGSVSTAYWHLCHTEDNASESEALNRMIKFQIGIGGIIITCLMLQCRVVNNLYLKIKQS